VKVREWVDRDAAGRLILDAIARFGKEVVVDAL
jgi:hypothetical protein